MNDADVERADRACAEALTRLLDLAAGLPMPRTSAVLDQVTARWLVTYAPDMLAPERD